MDTYTHKNKDNSSHTKIGIRALTLITVLGLSACASNIGKLPKQSDIAIPEKWQVEITERGSKTEQDSKENDSAQPIEEGAVGGWLKSFANDDLNKYVQLALKNNPDLLSSASQLKSAIEQVTINGASLWPNVSANLRRTRTEATGTAAVTPNTDPTRNDDVAGLSDNVSQSVSTVIRTVSGTLDVSWEIDVWQKLSERKKSASFSALAQAELYKAGELSLVANVSRAWFNLVTNKLQVDLANQRLESFQRTASLIDENYKRGLRSALDVYLSRSDVQVQVSSLADTEFNYVQSLRSLKTLLGEYPNSDLEFEATLPLLDEPTPIGLPAQLLTRRPDLKASQLQYQASIATAKATRRDRYPSLTFNGSIGDSRDSFNKLFDNDNLIVTLIGGITQPLFQAGALKSREEQALYQAEASYGALLKTTLTAFEEVENALSREQSLMQQHDAIKEAVDYAQGGLDLALDRYQSGIENYTTVLESQRRLFDSLRNEINLRNALLQNRIGIHLALGGDFSSLPEREPTDTLPSISARSPN